jgi:hypothetical protein
VSSRHSRRAPRRQRRWTTALVCLLALVVAALTVTTTHLLAPQATDPVADESILTARVDEGTTAPSSSVTPGTSTTTTEGGWVQPEVPAPSQGQSVGEAEDAQPAPSATGGNGGGNGGGGGTGGASGWLSGAAGSAATTGVFGAWRGSPIEITGTWADRGNAQTELWPVVPGGALSGYRGPLDIAIGAINEGESWSQAAAGAYDGRWAQSLQRLAAARSDDDTTYIRFAHEMNGNWYPWAVDRSERDDFIAAWHRFRDLQQSIFPDAQLVFCVNRESVGSGFDWRQSWPGDDQVDVLGVDYYNNWPYADSAGSFRSALGQTDQWGGPKGLQAHADFARAHGVPLAVPEWSGVADEGDSPGFVEGMHQFFTENAGSGPGRVLYEIVFDINNADYGGNFILSSPTTRLPETAEAYRRLF